MKNKVAKRKNVEPDITDDPQPRPPAEPLFVVSDTVEIPLTQGQVAVIDAEDYERVSTHTWFATWHPEDNAFFAETWAQKGKGKTILPLQRFITNAPPRLKVCFKTDNPLDCRKSNLCLTTIKNASRRQKLSRRNTSGYKGVCWIARSSRCMASIQVDGVQKYLGCFSSPIEAAREYDEAARRYFGEFARPNFAKDGELSALVDRPPRTNLEKTRTTRKSVNKTSGFKGVDQLDSGRWRAVIYPKGKRQHLGTFDTPVEAARAYDKAVRKYYGACGRLNFPKPGEMSARVVQPLQPAA